MALRFHPDKWPEGDKPAVTKLFQAIGAVYVEALNPDRQRRAQVRRVKTPAAAAAELGDLAELRRLLQERPSRSNEEDDNHIFPLMLAAKGGDVPCAAMLLEHGADLYAETPLGWNALLFAALHDQEHMVRFLVGQGMPVSTNDLLLAAFTGKPRGLQALLGLFDGSPASVRSESGKTLLHYACEGIIHVPREDPERYVVCAERLIDAGVPVDAPCLKKGRTCLQHFVGHQRWVEERWEQSPPHVQLVERLCAAGADPSLHDRDGNTAKTLAASLGLWVLRDIFAGARQPRQSTRSRL